MFFICCAVAGFVIFRTSILFFSLDMVNLLLRDGLLGMLFASVGWIIFHCNSNCTELLRVLTAVWWQRIIWELLEIAVQIFIFHIVSVAKQLSDVCAYFCVFRALLMKVFLVLRFVFLRLANAHFLHSAGFSIDSVLTDSLFLCSAFCYSIRMGRGNWFFIIKFSWNEFVYILRWACNERDVAGEKLFRFKLQSNCNPMFFHRIRILQRIICN